MIRRPWYRRKTSPTNCREVGRVLQHYLDGEMDPDWAARVAEHLEACKDCGLEEKTYREIKSSLARQQPSANDDAVARLREFGRSLTDE
jgi:anti-sigma factor RsiW